MSFDVIGLGEVVWDLMPTGRQLGGAPANFAYHAGSLGARAAVVTRVGEDDLGRELLRRFDELGIASGLVQRDARKATGTVAVELQAGGVPHFTVRDDVAWDWLAPTEAARAAVRRADAVCFGSLAQRHPASRAAIQQLVAAAPREALRIFDVNLRPPYCSSEVIEPSLRLANVLKLNDSELPVLAERFHLSGSPRQQLQHLAQEFELELVALTRGPLGSLLYQAGRWSDLPCQPVRVVDTVGAGDAFTAALTVGLLNQMDLDAVHVLASAVARYVCSQPGATPVLPASIRGPFQELVKAAR